MSQVNIASSFFEANTNLNVGNSAPQMTASRNNSDTFSQKLAMINDLTNHVKDTDKSSKKNHFEEQFKSNTTEKREETKKVEKNTNKMDSKTKEVSKKEVNKNEDIEDDGKETKSENEVIDQILSLMSQVLQVPVEEIQTQLDAIGLQVHDLLTEEGFSAFINEMYAQGDVNALLSGEIDMKQIRALFETLSDFKEQLSQLDVSVEDNLELEIPVYQETIDQKVDEGLIQIRVEDHQLAQEPMMENIEDKVIQQINPVKETLEEETMSGFSNDSVQGASDLGMTVPIHNFTTTTFTQAFSTGNGTVTQMTTTKQVMGGKTFIEQMDFKVLSQTKELNLTLSPKELGQMNIKIAEHNGIMTAEIKVENEKAKMFILNEIDALKDGFQEQGLNVTNVKVDIRQDNHQAQMEQEKQKSSKRIQEIISKHMGEEEEEESIIPIASESEIDYMV